MEGVRIHSTAEVSEKARIGKGTAIWNQSQVRENAEIGEGCNIGKNVYIDSGVKIGNNVKIQNNVNVYHGVTIEDDVFLGPSMTFTNDLYPRAFIWDDSRVEKTLVKKGASIGANATIVCGNRVIGKYAMVGSGSVVTRDVPDHGLVLGNPARLAGFACVCGGKLEKKPENPGENKGTCKDKSSCKSDEDITSADIMMHCPKCKKDITIPKRDYEMIRR